MCNKFFLVQALTTESGPRVLELGGEQILAQNRVTMDTPKRLQVSSTQPEICILSPRRQGHIWANKYTQLGDRQQTWQQRSQDLWEGSEGVFEDSLCCWVTGSDHVCATVLVVRRSSLAPTGSLRDQGGTRYQVLIMGCQGRACTGKGICQGDTAVSEG